MRKLKYVYADIDRCKAQIAATFDNPNMKDATIVREGYQKQLTKLEAEKEQALSNLKVINPRLVRG